MLVRLDLILRYDCFEDITQLCCYLYLFPKTKDTCEIKCPTNILSCEDTTLAFVGYCEVSLKIEVDARLIKFDVKIYSLQLLTAKKLFF